MEEEKPQDEEVLQDNSLEYLNILRKCPTPIPKLFASLYGSLHFAVSFVGVNNNSVLIYNSIRIFVEN